MVHNTHARVKRAGLLNYFKEQAGVPFTSERVYEAITGRLRFDSSPRGGICRTLGLACW